MVRISEHITVTHSACWPKPTVNSSFKALMSGACHQICLFPPYIPTFYCCHGYCIHLSIYPYWQCFKGICSLLVNVITRRQICDADSEASFTSLTNWEFTLFCHRTRQSVIFFFNKMRVSCMSATVSLWVLKCNCAQLRKITFYF